VGLVARMYVLYIHMFGTMRDLTSQAERAAVDFAGNLLSLGYRRAGQAVVNLSSSKLQPAHQQSSSLSVPPLALTFLPSAPPLGGWMAEGGIP
jgi:hypothetical protein